MLSLCQGCVSKKSEISIQCCFPTPILTTKLRSLGQCPLVLEPGNQPYLCSACDVAAAMGTTISQDYSVAIRSRQASTNPCFLFRRRREVSPAMGRRCLAHPSSHFPLPLLRWPCCVSLQRPYHDFQVGVIVGQPLRGSLRVHHLYANNSSRQSILHTPLIAGMAGCYWDTIFCLSVPSVVQWLGPISF